MTAAGPDLRLGRGLAAVVRCATRAPRRTVLVALAATVLAGGLTVGHLGVNSNPTDLFARDLPFRRHLHEFETAFPQFRDLLLIVLDGERSDEVRRAADALAARLRAEPDRFDSVFDPFGASILRDAGLLYLPLRELRAAVTTLTRTAPMLRYLEREPGLAALATAIGGALGAAAAPLPPPLVAVADQLAASIAAARGGRLQRLDWVGALASTDLADRNRLILVTQPTRDYSRFLPSAPAIERTRELVAELGLAQRGVRVRLTGDVALEHEELDEASRGAITAGVLAFVLVATFLIVGLRSLRFVAAALITLSIGLVWTAAWAALAIGHLNLISVAFAVLSISLGVDFSIHLSLRLQELLDAGHDVEAGLEFAARDVGGSLTLAAVTTAIGFAAFMTGDFTGVGELGAIAGCGVLISLAVNLVVLPALLCCSPLRPAAGVRAPAPKPAALVGLISGLHARPRATLLFAALLGIGALMLAPTATFDANPLNLKNPHTESVRTFQDLAADPDTTPYDASVIAADAASAAALAQAIEALDVVASTIALEDLIPADQDVKQGLVARAREALAEPPPEPSSSRPSDADLDRTLGALGRVLAQRAEADAAVTALHSQIAGLRNDLESAAATGRGELLGRIEAATLGALPEAMASLRQLVRTDAVGLDDFPAAFRERWETADGRRRVEIRPRADLADPDALERFVTAILAVAPSATGGPIVVVESARVAVEAFRTAFVVAAVAMALLLLLALRSLRDVAIILCSLAYATATTVALTVLFGLSFNFANTIALPLLLGISVDNSIHIVHRFRVDPVAGNRLLQTSTTRAVLFSSLTTLGGFGTLIVSPHPGTASLGLLLTIGVLTNLACTLVLLPMLVAHVRAPRALSA